MLGHTLTKTDITFGQKHSKGRALRGDKIRGKSPRELRHCSLVVDGSAT